MQHIASLSFYSYRGKCLPLRKDVLNMTTQELYKQICQDLDSRKLKNPTIRKNAAKKILEFVKHTKYFLSNNSITLPNEKDKFKEAYIKYKNKDLNDAEKSVINMIYKLAITDITNEMNLEPILTNAQCNLSQLDVPEDREVNVEQDLIFGSFIPVHSLLDENTIPDKPGIYCIKLCNGIQFSKEFGKIREDGIIYIGQASKSLKKRLWEEELNHMCAATFFRSIGAMLGFLPPKGSLANKQTNNFKFSEEDTASICKWMQESLLVNFVVLNPMNVEIDKIEISLIEKYSPIVNIKHNKIPNAVLQAKRNKCREYAKMLG